MARERIGSRPKKEKVSLVFKERPKARSALFGKPMNAKLTKGEEDYFKVAELLTKGEGVITAHQLGAFFAQQYRFRFGTDCIDYNWFNFSKTAQSVKDYLKLESNLELAQFFAESFEKYSKVRTKLRLNEPLPTVSTFKRAFILEELRGNGGTKFEGFY